jgi:phage terminase large subunit-like protein
LKIENSQVRLDNYIRDVQSGKILSGRLVKLAVERYVRDLESNQYQFNADKFNRCCDFIGKMKHYVGKHRGKPFLLEGWQLFIVANIVALYIKDTDTRKYTYSYIQIARKNGKTFLASALSLYFLIADAEYSAEVVLAANTFQQSQLLYNVCYTLMAQMDPRYKFHNVHRGKDIEYFPTRSILHTIASKSRGLDGFNASFGIIDEYHAAPDSSVRNVIASSMGMRENPHLMTITTAGFDMESVCYQLRNDCVDVLNGIKEDTNLFGMIFELDADDDYADEKNWIKSNPNLDLTVRKDWLRDQITSAQMFKNEEVNVLTKNMNMWINGSYTWIEDKYILQSMTDFPDFVKEDVIAYVGVDLSSVSDLTAVNFLIKHNDIYYFDTRYYLPQQYKTDSQYNRMKFEEWARNGHLTLTPGNVTDYDYILKDILKYPYYIRAIYYDSYNATQFAINATQEGIECIPYSQSTGSFNRPTKELERLILSGQVIFKKNPITVYCYRNVVLKQDMYGNVKPDKSNREKKIDGVIAQIMSMAGYLLDPVSPSIF